MNRLTFSKKRRIDLGCFLFVFLTGILGFSSTIYASNEVYSTPWDGTVAAVTPNGRTYIVTTAEELAWIAQQNASMEGFRGKTVRLAANIDLNGADRKRVWTPIGSKDQPFEGTFDGARYLIRGLSTFDTDEGAGLFGYVGSHSRVNDVGISGGCIIAYGQNRVGALIGVSEGAVSCCWSMAEIALSGNVTGGLIGEMLPSSTLADAYCCSLIRNAGDTVGVLVGKNAGTISNSYTTGYAKNGCSFVGVSTSRAKYNDCYYDRKLYHQEPGAVAKGLTAIDTTYQMFDCMQGKRNWLTTSHTATEQGLYPQLRKFKYTDASRLSVAPIIVDTESRNPINHANDLTENFRVDTSANISWQTQELSGSAWIQFSDESDEVTVVRPCAETDVLATATLSGEQNTERRTVYFRPRRVDDLKPGTFDGINAKDTICWRAEVAVTDLVMSENELLGQKRSFYAQDGFGTHHYMVVWYGYDESDQPYAIDTLERDLREDTIQYSEYTTWCETTMIKSDTVGAFMLRVFAHDDRCTPNWIPCEGQLSYTVLPKRLQDAGAIESGERAQCFEPGEQVRTISVIETNPASGDGTLEYRWLRIDGLTEEVIGSDKDLTIEMNLADVDTDKVYTYVRDVRQNDCEWVRSDGELKERYGFVRTGELTRTVCKTELPATIYWQDPQGNVFSHVIAKGVTSDKWNVRDEYNHGNRCPADTLITIYVQDKPQISSESNATFCQNENNIIILFEQTSGDMDLFYIEYSSLLAKYMGANDTTGVIQTPGMIVFNNVPPLPDASGLYIDLQVASSEGTYSIGEIGCYSDAERIQIESRLGGYVHAKFNRLLYVDNNPDNGEVPAPKLHFTAYQWYKDGDPVDGATSQYYQENGQDLKGVYNVLLTDDKGNTYRSCDFTMPNEQSSSPASTPALYPVPVDAGAPLTVTCYGGTIEICSGTGERVLTAGTDKESMVIDAPRMTGIYHVRITHADGTTQTEKLIVK